MPAYPTGEIAASVAVGTATVFRTRRRFVEGDLEAARKLSGTQEALLVEAPTYAELTGNPHLSVNSVCRWCLTVRQVDASPRSRSAAEATAASSGSVT